MTTGVRPENIDDLDSKPVFKDELLLVFSPSHPWADGRPISREELRRQPFILYQRHSLTARLLDDYFRSVGIAPTTLMEIGNLDAIKEMVKLNLGVSVLAPWVADREVARGRILMRPVGPVALKREWMIAFRAGRRLGLPEETFCRLCRTVASGLRKDRRDVPAPAR